jgi:amidophosphoribosyltransferase
LLSLREVFCRCIGGYSALIIADDALVAVRDPNGVWPLCYGSKDGGYVVASESCALDLVDATYRGDILPGEMVVFSRAGLSSSFPFKRQVLETSCALEFAYFGRPDSVANGMDLYSIRKELGRQLARESPALADVVVPMPDVEMPGALGFSEESGIPFDVLLFRNHYTNSSELLGPVSRVITDFEFRRKTSGAAKVLQGKRVVVLDDSMLRGKNAADLVRLLRDRGAVEVHLRMCFPPIRHPCVYGASSPPREDLIAARCSVEEIRREVGADSLAFLSEDGMRRVLDGYGGGGYCFACSSGVYPVY